MHSKASASELLLGKLGVERLQRGAKVRVMVGGLGLGFTLRGVLYYIGAEAQVDVVELVPQVVEWNRQYLRDLNGALLPLFCSKGMIRCRNRRRMPFGFPGLQSPGESPGSVLEKVRI